ncbi:MAG: DUF2431 domain-containing protein [Nanoarchaeota archaeon]|nr:DUF2431 domain-containing protein [Nanoarchaeota archaeon]
MIYEPADDSYLMEKVVRKYSKGKKVLDMGSGSGIQAQSALEAGAKEVIAVDINKESVVHVKSLGIKSIQSSLFSKVKGEFDLIIFNPPYLPFDVLEDNESALATTGGKKGDEIILKFLKACNEHLEKKGVILLVVSSLTPLDKIKKLLKKQAMEYKIVESKKIFMEELEVLEIQRAKLKSVIIKRL